MVAQAPNALSRLRGDKLGHRFKQRARVLVRRLAQERPRVGSRRALLSWAGRAGVDLREAGEPGILELVTDQPTARK